MNDGYQDPITVRFMTGGKPARLIIGCPILDGATDIPPKSWIVCDNGHKIAYVKDGLEIGGHLNSWSERLTRWHQPEPAAGSHPDYTCDVCSASWGPAFKCESA